MCCPWSEDFGTFANRAALFSAPTSRHGSNGITSVEPTRIPLYFGQNYLIRLLFLIPAFRCSKEHAKAMALQCPFCLFAEFDSYAVIEHVECCHPETGESPFVVRHDEEMSRSDALRNEMLALTFSKNPLQDEEYFECDCGEVVRLIDINSHMALHGFEETVVSEDTSAAILRRNKLSSVDDLQVDSISPADDVTFPPKPASSKLHKRRSHGVTHKSHHGHHGPKNLVDVMFASKSSRSRPKKTIARDDKPRRLGVRCFPEQEFSGG